MSALSISTRLLLSYLLVAALPLGGLAALYLASFETSLRETVLANMAILADKKADQIDTYMGERLADIRQLGRRDVIRHGVASLEHAFRTGGPNSAAYQAASRRLRDELESTHAAGGYYDLLLIDAAGNVVFSMAREPDSEPTSERVPIAIRHWRMGSSCRCKPGRPSSAALRPMHPRATCRRRSWSRRCWTMAA
jgi:hypothetical protein